MPLDRAHITTASRLMLPVYALFFAGVGLSLTLTPQPRLRQTPAFAYADRLLDLDWWGAGYLVVALALTLALVLRHRATYRAALAVGCVWMAGWAVLVAVSAWEGQASFAAWTWPAFVALASYATLRSLAVRER